MSDETIDDIKDLTDDPMILKCTELAYKIHMMMESNPALMELDSFMIVGSSENGDVHVGCWELTEDMVDDLINQLNPSNRNRTNLTDPVRSN